MAANPYMKRYTLTNANQNYELSTLMRNVDSHAPRTFHKLQIQAQVTGSQLFRIGNFDLSDTNCGVELYASQAFGVEAPTNSISGEGIYLRCNAAGKYVNVVVHVL